MLICLFLEATISIQDMIMISMEQICSYRGGQINYKLGKSHLIGLAFGYGKQMDRFEETFNGTVVGYFNVQYFTFLASYKYRFQ